MIEVQFCSFKSFFGDLIPWFGAAPDGVGHVDAIFPEGLLGAQHQSLGGKPSGVYMRPMDYGKTCGMRGRVRVSFDVKKNQEDIFRAFLLNQIGKPYDVMSIKDFFTGSAGRDWRQSDSWFCSELIAAALEQARVFQNQLESPVNKITPGGLLLVCSAFVTCSRISDDA